ncbi:hypothetical protein Taro_005153 [Colocasia esculenta]|uniref:Uncharacterized protein n=1 Tax=Colocasia esculenta TaxID=4460 RepID=A0A843TS79_COLES|nr:hypothetical protein [Colocasia esculenta]
MRRTNRSPPSQRRGTSPEDLRERILERQMASSFAGTRERLASVGEEKSLRRGSPRESFAPLEARGPNEGATPGFWRVVRRGCAHGRRGRLGPAGHASTGPKAGSDRRGGLPNRRGSCLAGPCTGGGPEPAGPPTSRGPRLAGPRTGGGPEPAGPRTGGDPLLAGPPGVLNRRAPQPAGVPAWQAPAPAGVPNRRAPELAGIPSWRGPRTGGGPRLAGPRTGGGPRWRDPEPAGVPAWGPNRRGAPLAHSYKGWGLHLLGELCGPPVTGLLVDGRATHVHTRTHVHLTCTRRAFSTVSRAFDSIFGEHVLLTFPNQSTSCVVSNASPNIEFRLSGIRISTVDRPFECHTPARFRLTH